MAKLVAALFFVLTSGSAFANTNGTHAIESAKESAAAFLINGKINTQLARAFSALNANGMLESSNEEKAVAILEANRADAITR